MMMKKKNLKLGIKDYVNYFDANCLIKKVHSHYDLSTSLKSNLFVLEASSDDINFVPVFESCSYVACKRHMKYLFLTSGFSSIYLVRFIYLSPTGYRVSLGFNVYSLSFNFERHEQLCEI